MNFERFRSALACQSFVGCGNPEHWNSYRKQFESLSLADSQAFALRQALNLDAEDLYFKGSLSLCEAVNSLTAGRFSWAIVKLYYSIFYYLRTILAVRGYAVIRNKALYLLKARTGESVSKHNYNDHEGVINLYKNLFSASDPLQGNTINGLVSYDWMMNLRNQVNYRERLFHEPHLPNWLTVICGAADRGDLDGLIDLYINDSLFVYCFQADHAALALPVRCALLARSELVQSGLNERFTAPKSEVLSRLLGANAETQPMCAAIIF